MEKPWLAENAVSKDLARALIEEQFPEFAPARLELVGVGWDNSMWRVNGEFAFRFPRREIAVPLLQAECMVLPRIADRLPLGIPVPEYCGTSAGGYPWPFSGCRWIEGRTACRAGLSSRDRHRVAAPLAQFLRALHSIDAEQARAIGAAPDTFGRLDVERRGKKAAEQIREGVERGLIDEPSPLLDLIEDTPTDYQPAAAVLAHGDLYARHLVVDEERMLTGIIDWGDLHLGDPAVDLSVAHGFLPPEARQEFRDAYGPIDPDAWKVARLKSLVTTLWILFYGDDVKDEALFGEARTALQHLAD